MNINQKMDIDLICWDLDDALEAIANRTKNLNHDQMIEFQNKTKELFRHFELQIATQKVCRMMEESCE